MFYVYEWFIIDTNEVFYVGKGCKDRYKNTLGRNKMFQEFYKRFNCNSRIIKMFDNEEDAFKYEHIRIMQLKAINQAVCNLDYGGKGGTHLIWTPEMREYKSVYNPMKLQEQRKRMSKDNPMKNPVIAKKVGNSHKKGVVINNEFFECAEDAAKKFKVHKLTVSNWCKRGYNTNGEPCRFEKMEQKPLPKIKINHPRAKNYKSVIIDNIHFDTVKDGANYIGVWSESLISAIKNNRPCKGHICKYDNQQPSSNLKD